MFTAHVCNSDYLSGGCSVTNSNQHEANLCDLRVTLRFVLCNAIQAQHRSTKYWSRETNTTVHDLTAHPTRINVDKIIPHTLYNT